MTKAEHVRQNKIALARDLIESGISVYLTAKAVKHSQHWVRTHARAALKERAERRRARAARSKRHRLKLERLTADLRPTECGPRLTTAEKFERFRRERPEVEAHLYRFASAAHDRGRKVGMRCLWERLRWEVFVEASPAEDYALNNNYAPLYARLLMRKHPELRGFFETRNAPERS